jgi:CRISPR-associated endonuclease/helicase Cas3
MSLPSFEAFSQAVWNRPPFPWQCRLADEVLDAGWSNLVLELPTGAGKTSALDVALYCLARAPDRMPRRTVLVVDRRIVVDQAALHARRLLETLAQAKSGAAAEIAGALRRTYTESEDDLPFRVAVMRGGMPRDNDWARWPHQPVLASSTVDQLGSRLLFRGYGIHRMSASIHAGLIGNDTLVLLDEVHLAHAFATTLHHVERIFGGRRSEAVHAIPRRFFVVPMSATPPELENARPFGLSDEDRGNETLKRRLAAHKLAKLVMVRVSGDDEHKKLATIAKQAVDKALELQTSGLKVIGVIVNRVATAHLAFRELRERGAAAILLTGRMRPLDRDRLVNTELKRVLAGRDRTSATPLIVVATQCIEAGADLDLDGIVTECASLDALRQRFGRVDRRGELGESRSVVLGRSDADEEDPVYGRALPRTWAWLEANATQDTLDFGIDWLPACTDPATLPEHVAPPVLLPAHLDAWAQTSLPIHPDPEVSLWLHGPARPSADVQIVWRDLGQLVQQNSLAESTVSEYLEAIRPSTLEAITVPIATARRWLAGEDPQPYADTTAAIFEDDRPSREPPRLPIDAWCWDGERASKVEELRPGQVIVVDCAAGGLQDDAFDPESLERVSDLGELAQLRSRGIATLVFSVGGLRRWGVDVTGQSLIPEGDESESEYRRRMMELVRDWPLSSDSSSPVTEADRTQTQSAFARRMQITQIGPVCVATARVPRPDRDETIVAYESITESEDSSFRGDEITLQRHSKDVKQFVTEFARMLHLDPKLRDDLALAAWLHDVGKADPRFQSWLVGGDALRASVLDEPLAKSGLDAGSARRRREARNRARYPEGYRHELLSLAMVTANEQALADANDPDLVKHLVASHHGWCRPFAAPLDDDADVAVDLRYGDAHFVTTTRHHLARLDSGVVDRFWDLNRKYGWWGLAWLEAILRLADHRASEAAELARGKS